MYNNMRDGKIALGLKKEFSTKMSNLNIFKTLTCLPAKNVISGIGHR